MDPFSLIEPHHWKKALPSIRTSALSALSIALTHLEEDDDVVSRSWRILHRAILDPETLLRHVGLRFVTQSIVSWRDPYFHHNPTAIDRLIHALTTVAQNDPAHRTRLAAIDAIGAACIALSSHLSDEHPKDSTETITHLAQWMVGRLISCLALDQTHGWSINVSMERVHYIYAIGLLYEHCGSYLNASHPSMYETVLYLLHRVVSHNSNAATKSKKSKRSKKNKVVVEEDHPFEDRAVFYVLNHRLEDDLIIGQLFLSIGKSQSLGCSHNLRVCYDSTLFYFLSFSH